MLTALQRATDSCLVSDQGNGYATDANLIASRGISDPNPFFQTLLTKPYLGNVVIAPHIYGPSIALLKSGYTGPELWTTLTQTVGYLNGPGYCSGEKCHKFPIVVGETGSDLKDPRDFEFYDSLRQYFNNVGGAADGQHSVINSVFWWSW